MPAVYPSAQNTYIRSHEATNNMVVDYSRNIDKFAVNQYTQMIPVDKQNGYYLEMTIEEAGRLLHTDGKNFLWMDRMPAPEGNDGLEKFEYKPYDCDRYAIPVLLGDLTIDQASWNILAQHTRIKSQQAMTFRTQQAVTTITTSGNYDSSHVLDVTSDISDNQGTWAESTTARQDIKRSLNYGRELILDDTLAAVDLDDLLLVISSGLAAKLIECQEIVDYIKASPDSTAQVRGELPGRNVMYGLPDRLYGMPIVVEATRKVTTKKGASTTTRSSVMPDDNACMLSRPGGLIGVDGAPSFSTITFFMKEEMTVETKRDDDNRRTKARVVENYDVKLTAPASGILFTETS